MIRTIVRKSYLPMQAIFYTIQRKKHANKMMSYFLKLNPKKYVLPPESVRHAVMENKTVFVLEWHLSDILVKYPELNTPTLNT